MTTPEKLPLVTIMIATRDRGPELERTLAEMRRQDYPAVELLVIDDGSREPVAPIVAQYWPEGRVIRYEQNAGQTVRRNEGFQGARGEFILHLDDDCHLVGAGALRAAVAEIAARPGCGCLIFDLFNGPELPLAATVPPPAGCVRSFIGAAALFRTAAIRSTAGYRAFYRAQGEEDELALQILGQGWFIYYWPQITAHHRLSSLNRQSVATWERGVGNDIWTLLIHFPLRRLPVEIGWKLLVAAWDAIRLGRGIVFLRALRRLIQGAPQAWRLRSPLDELALRRFDAMRLFSKISVADFTCPPRMGLRGMSTWWRNWRNRARDGSAWDDKPNLGKSATARYAHEVRDRA